MDNNNLLPTHVHQRKTTKKKTKSKQNNPIKVVYISNPMKVKTSASQFRALVQELTGQDAELPDPTKFQASDDLVAGHQTVSDSPMMKIADDDDRSEELPVLDPSHDQEKPQIPSYQFEPLDDVFTPQMFENLSGLLPTSVFYDSPHVDVLRSLDAV